MTDRTAKFLLYLGIFSRATTVFGNQLRHLLQRKGEFNIWLVIAAVAVVAIGLFELRWWFVKTKQVSVPDKDRSR